MLRAFAASALLVSLTSCGSSGIQSLLDRIHPTAIAASSTDPVSFHRKLEPDGRVILHGAGQTDDATFRDYSLALVQSRPMLYMSYVDLKDNLPAYFNHLHHDIDLYPDYIVPQIGLSLNQGDAARRYEDAVAAGSLDPQLTQLCTGLKSLDRPVYLRIGYEFDAPWNGYAPNTYIAAFRRIVTTLRACHADAVAAVWDFAPLNNASANYAAFYPGDDYVDWWAINLFPASSLTASATRQFLSDALAHRFPVMIGESTPQFHSTSEGPKVVHDWYQPYFDLILANPQIKAFCYINWNWAQYPQWSDWGDARIQSNPSVLSFFKNQLTAPIFQSATSRAATFKLLHAESLLPPPIPQKAE